LRETIEGVYSGWFIPQLSTAWSKVMEGPQGLLKGWALPEVTPQQAFFERKVLQLFEGGAKRVFVVISDAFRFEAAEELASTPTARAGSRRRWTPCWACCRAIPPWAWPRCCRTRRWRTKRTPT
jgi:hypothetical protein